jgi:hypothetical protein
MSLELIVVVLAAAAIVVLVGLAAGVRPTPRRRSPSRADRRPGPFDGARDVIDRSIGMYLLRGLTRRANLRPADPAARSADEPDHAPGVAGEPAMSAAATIAAVDGPAGRTSRANVTFYEVPASAPAALAQVSRVAPGPRVSPVASMASVASVSPVVPVSRAPLSAAPTARARLVRDTGFALTVLGVIGLAVVVWPRGPAGMPGADPAVVRGTVTPGPGVTTPVNAAASAPANPTGLVAGETDAPSATPTRIPLATPTPAGVATRPPKSTQRPQATPKATPTPPPATPGSTATPSPAPTPTPTPISTPDASPIDTPVPTAAVQQSLVS